MDLGLLLKTYIFNSQPKNANRHKQHTIIFKKTVCLTYIFVDDFIVVGNTTTVFGTPRKDGYGDTVVSFMAAIYLITVNILLLNVIIAQFR